jgi:signal transduction histidine kinase
LDTQQPKALWRRIQLSAPDSAIELQLPVTELTFATIGSRIFKLPSFDAQLQFHRQYNIHSATFARFGLFVGLLLYLLFYLWDRLVDYERSADTLIVRIVISAAFLTISMLPLSLIARYLQTLMLFAVTIAGFGVVYIISIERDGLNSGLSGVMLVLMFNFGFFRLLFIPSLIAGCLIIFAYEIASVLIATDSNRILANNFFLASALISGACITYLLERLFRAQFIVDQELQRERDALARQVQTDSRHLEWLRRLAVFLRHEVRHPIAQINSSIELIEMKSGRSDALRSHIENASLSARHVWNLLDRASRATDMEAFVRRSHPYPIELSPLVAQVTSGFRETQSGIRFQFDAHASPRICADPTLISEAVSNLISNAASFALEDSTVLVSTQADGGRSIIRVQNKGPLLDTDNDDALFGAFTSTRADPTSEHHGLGLYLVRLVAEHYGGTATIRNLDDHSGVEATVSLPQLS